MSVEALIEADDVALRFHLNAPEVNRLEFEGLVDELVKVKQAWRQARFDHDAKSEARAAEDWLDVITILAAAADGLAAQRRTSVTYGMPPITVFYLDLPGR